MKSKKNNITEGFPAITLARRKGLSIRKKDWFDIVMEYRYHRQGKHYCRGQSINLPLLKEVTKKAITAHLGADSFREFHLPDMKGQPTVGIEFQKISKKC